MAEQQFLFIADQTVRADGAIVVKAKRLVDGKPISAKRAAAMLGFRDRETIYRLIRSGEILAWKPKSKRDNGRYRVDLGAVLDYKARRERIARGECAE
jgi:hypothetical protein